MNKKNSWLKLKQDFFSSLAMKKLKTINGGDGYIVIYLKIMLLTINDEGCYNYQEMEEDIISELALILDETLATMQAAIAIFKALKLIDFIDSSIFVPQVPLLIGKNDDSTARVQAYRERKQLECTPEKINTLPAKTKVLECNAYPQSQQIIDYWQDKTNLKATPATLKTVTPIITKLLKTYSTNDMTTVIDFILTSEYHIQGGYTTLQSIFKPTKFDEKLSRAQAANNPSLKAKSSTKDAIRTSLYTDDPSRRTCTPEEKEKLKKSIIPF